ncbi:peptidoglycan-binding protein LysM [Pseudomonas sp. SA3-5]|uniref:Peptidoglycan-binding protein LysM n=1 Tax=Pseudomonas aestuarii TaxID=3018340 RepID=A0ABT4XHQ3_9PSED|nr:FimV/HubP family polar landmark protein [Pseudomonas aestuarii]MDA7087738.1 peptidoglycan-binding protein LysM [Pseudomonas aestuarii]
MSRVRQLLFGLASSSAFYSGVVPALGLGEITLHSALNQPLEAEIELLQVADLSSGDLLVRLASAEVFSRSGVDRLFFLNDLRFTPLLRGSNSVIRVVSSQPVREPYLNFIVEVARPNGALLREYTLLLDPPGSSAYRTVAAVPKVRAASERQVVSAPSAVAAAPRVMPAADAGARYQVASGDSLWKIAAGLRAAGSQASQQALMRDIHALNPQAFSRGDINRLRAGADLLLPDTAQAGSAPIASAEALAPVDPPVDPQVEQVAQMQRRLDQELLSQAEENLRLQQGITDLQAQLQQLQEQVGDKDRQLAELQAQLVARPALAPASPVSAVAESSRVELSESAVPPSRNWFSAAVAALVLLLAGLLGLFWRNRRPSSPLTQQVQPIPEPATKAPEPVAPLLKSVPPAARVSQATVAAVTPPDALEGANIYIAYGRYGEAAVILGKALDVQPERSDIRFRLLEVLAQQGNAQAFAEEEAKLRAAGFTAARIDQLKARHPGLRDALVSGEMLDDATLVLDEPQLQAPVQEEGGLDDDFQLNLDDLSLDADWDLVSPFPTSMRKKDAASVPEFSERDDVSEAFESAGHRDARSPFAQNMLVEEASADDWLQEDLSEGFLDQPPAADGNLLHDLDQLAGNHDNLAKLNLALAYIDQGSLESACDILNEVINDGDDEEKQEARELLAKIA